MYTEIAKNHDNEDILIKRYVDLTEMEKVLLLEFIQSYSNPLSPGTIQEMDNYFNSSAFNFGKNHWSCWENGHAVSSIGYVDKEIPIKGEAYMASVYCLADYRKTVRYLYERALECSEYQEGFTIKLGLFREVRYLAPEFQKIGFREEYHLVEMSHDLEKEENEDFFNEGGVLEYETVKRENLEVFLRIHNDAFINSPNGATMDLAEGLTMLEEKREISWQMLLFKKDDIPVGIVILDVKDEIGTIEGLAVDPTHMGKGNGKRVLQSALKIMGEKGLKTALLQVMDNNKRAYELYLKNGFIITNIHSDWYSKKIEGLAESEKPESFEKPEKQKNAIDGFLDEEGKIKQMPSKKEPRQAILAYLATKFADGVSYSEKEVNEIVSEWHTFNDYFLLRRELVDYKFLSRTRDGSKYWK